MTGWGALRGVAAAAVATGWTTAAAKGTPKQVQMAFKEAHRRRLQPCTPASKSGDCGSRSGHLAAGEDALSTARQAGHQMGAAACQTNLHTRRICSFESTCEL